MAGTETFFSHMGGARLEGVPMQNATRYLCAAAYLDERFARRVIAEFVENGHRGVVPSFGFDVVPVISHCLRARRMRIIRDGVLTGVLLLGLALSWLAVLVAVVVWGPLAALPFLRRARLPHLRRLIVWMVLIWLLFTALTLGFPAMLSAINGGGITLGNPGYDDGYGSSSGGALLSLFVLTGTMVFGALLLVPLGYRWMVYRTLRTLGPGAPTQSPQVVSSRVEKVLDRVATAQRGNITLYSHENPFLGSGDLTEPFAHAWSIAVELDRKSGSSPLGLDGDGAGPDEARPVDPMELHRHVHRSLVAMRDGLPPHERIGGLLVDWHVVAQGRCMQGPRPSDPAGTGPQYQGHPLIDPLAAVPYSRASETAIEAIVRHPQADIRCYQRVTVSTPGQAIRDRSGNVLAPAQDQDIFISAFLYLAVEGRMLYAQFVADVMPPIRDAFRIVDELPGYTTGMLLLRVLREGGTRALGEGFLGPSRLVRTCLGMLREAIRASGRLPTWFLTYDYGARISVRQEAAEPGFRTFMQLLDADKYTNLIERRINEAVLDHLQQCGIDITAYREQAAMVLNNPFIMSGGSISGSQIAVGGAGSRIVQQQTRPSAQGASR